MPKTVNRDSINALLPPGILWEPEPNEGFDQQLDGIADTTEDVKAVLDTLADIRNPYKTPVFEDLERNYGINPNPSVSMDIRIARLAQKVYQGAKVNSIEDLQGDLDAADFDLQVHKNDPPVDPATFLAQAFQITAGSDKAFAGYHEGGPILAFAASLGGELLVNTPIVVQTSAIDMQAGGDFAYAGFTDDGFTVKSVAGHFTGFTKNFLDYDIPTNPIYWPLIFFIGGDVTRNGAGEITEIEAGLVDSNRSDELSALILADKNIGTWAAMIINFI